MLREFNAFYCNIEGRCIFGSSVLSPPFNHLNCFRLALCPMWRAKELETKFTVNIQDTICANKLKNGGAYILTGEIKIQPD